MLITPVKSRAAWTLPFFQGPRHGFCRLLKPFWTWFRSRPLDCSCRSVQPIPTQSGRPRGRAAVARLIASGSLQIRLQLTGILPMPRTPGADGGVRCWARSQLPGDIRHAPPVEEESTHLPTPRREVGQDRFHALAALPSGHGLPPDPRALTKAAPGPSGSSAALAGVDDPGVAVRGR